MLIGVIADDFTGASDIGVTLAKGLSDEGGVNTALYMGIPDSPAAEHIDAGVIALKSRSQPVDEAVADSLAACDWLIDQGCQQIIFKYCSTFDSTPEGNIGPVAEALAQRLGARGVVVCPAFPDMGRTVYQGHLFVGDKPLHESGMEHHPLTPMTDPDVRRLLSQQIKGTQGFISWQTVQKGHDALAAALDQQAAAGHTFVVVDAITNGDLVTLGAACKNAKLVTGGSAVAQALPHNFISRGEVSGSFPPDLSLSGPGAVLVGSCSRMTLQQIAKHEQDYAVLHIDAQDLLSESISLESVIDFVFTQQSRIPLVTTSKDAANVSDLQARYGRQKVAAAIEDFFAALAVRLADEGVTRLVVGGGETSGAVVKGLALKAVVIGAEISTGIPSLRAEREGRSMVLALKSGNFGSEAFFRQAFLALDQKIP